ncbi:MAG: short-chain dehydrogenase [Betaproteobacteria bacterium RIFCSPHIGHO2_12_FULL_69_13]|nr:MAG: short-chain dehydrogenase [Betaproteobacteria bacterium RIFCSPHIGHO2_12_FULL_69_13]OGA71041.1 MAG: short-chain dehydrogenase [Betaproteobacteria bacterium RIFCSPLOWO2_12_FULL_68_20]
MELGLNGRVALVTGGSKGIGLAVARQLAAEGCALHLVARTQADLEAARGEIVARHRVPVTVHAMDLAGRGRAEELGARCGELDILVNNAGATPRGALDEVDEERWRQAFDLKVFGYINLSRVFYARMKARRRGVIVNIIGNGGERVDYGYIAGAAGNAALMAFTRALGAGSIDFGVRVLGVNPGPVATERLVGLMKKEAQARFGDAARWRELEKGFPLARSATPEEIAATVTLLASDLSSYTTGTIVTIDGGMANRGSLI